MRKRIVTLGFKKSVEAIKDVVTVNYRCGVWNDYTKAPVNKVIGYIERSGYGADVFYDDKNGEYYVSIPSDGDMW